MVRISVSPWIDYRMCPRLAAQSGDQQPIRFGRGWRCEWTLPKSETLRESLSLLHSNHSTGRIIPTLDRGAAERVRRASRRATLDGRRLPRDRLGCGARQGMGDIKAFATASSCSHTRRMAASGSPHGRLDRRNPRPYPPELLILSAPRPCRRTPPVPSRPPPAALQASATTAARAGGPRAARSSPARTLPVSGPRTTARAAGRRMALAGFGLVGFKSG